MKVADEARTSVSRAITCLFGLFTPSLFADSSSSELSEYSAVLSDICDALDFDFRLS